MGVEMCDLPENLHAFYEIVGERGFVEVCKLYGGEVLYLPSYRSVMRASRNRDICKRFNGFNSSQLANEYGITANHVRKIAKYDC